MAQNAAFKKKKNIKVVWRNYQTTVMPTGEKFTLDDLRGHLLLALKEILKLHKMDKFNQDEESIFQALLQDSTSSLPSSPSPAFKKKGSYTDVEV